MGLFRPHGFCHSESALSLWLEASGNVGRRGDCGQSCWGTLKCEFHEFPQIRKHASFPVQTGRARLGDLLQSEFTLG